jgi:hypothetical protein
VDHRVVAGLLGSDRASPSQRFERVAPVTVQQPPSPDVEPAAVADEAYGLPCTSPASHNAAALKSASVLPAVAGVDLPSARG